MMTAKERRIMEMGIEGLKMMTTKERRITEMEMTAYREYLDSPRVCQSCGQTFPNKDFLLVTEPIENSWLQRLCPECHEVWEDGRDNWLRLD